MQRNQSSAGELPNDRRRKVSVSADQAEDGEELEEPECIPELEKIKQNTKQFQDSELPRVNGDLVFALYVLAWFGGLYLSMKAQRNMELWPPYQLFGIEEKLISSYDPKTWVKFTHDNWWVPALSTIVYLIMVFYGPKLMEKRSRPTWLKIVLVQWNAFLFLGSTLGAYRLLPPLIQEMQNVGFRTFLCGEGTPKSESLEDMIAYFKPFCKRCGAGCLWLNLFILSKIPEMLDSLFLVLGKKQIRSLHWWHHVSVLWFCWMSWSYSPLGSTLYAMMNITVHSLMYFWYFLAAADNLLAVGLKPGKLLSQMVTVLQIAQMIMGTAVTFYFPTQSANDCYYIPRVNAFGVLIYSTYLILFVRFFVKAYCFKKMKKVKKQK